MTTPPDKNPLVTLMIPSYNHARHIEETIESVLNQTYPNCEIIVVDDGSTDETDRVLRALLEKKQGCFQYVPKKHEGIVASLNLGLEMSRGKYFAPLASDDVLMPDSVERRVEAMESDPRLGLVMGDAYVLRNGTKTGETCLSDKWRNLARRADPYRELLKRDFVVAPTVLYRSEVIRQLGGWDPDVPHIEDWDSVLRVVERHPLRFLDPPLSYWRCHSANTGKKFELMFEGRMATLRKHFQQGRFSEDSGFQRSVYSRFHYNHGRDLAGCGRLREALSTLSQAFRYNPLDIRVYGRWLRVALRLLTSGEAPRNRENTTAQGQPAPRSDARR